MYDFIGEFACFYPHVITPEGSLQAKPGMAPVDFDALGVEVPNDGRWIKHAEPSKEAAKAAKPAAAKES